MLTQVVVWLNAAAGAIARFVLAPIAWLPGWVSATLIAVIAGVAMLWVFKHTSNQPAILRTKNQIKASLLALWLFQDNLGVSLRSQGRILASAGSLCALSLVPMLIMLAPMCLLLGQLAVWYEASPLPVDEEAVVTVHWNDAANPPPADAKLQPSSAFDLSAGPVRVPSEKLTCWRIRAMQPGLHELSVNVDGQPFTKEVAIGAGYLPVSEVRPGWDWSVALLHPRERPFPQDSIVQSIEIAYPDRNSWTSGTTWWMVYFFVASLVAAFAVRPLLKVNI